MEVTVSRLGEGEIARGGSLQWGGVPGVPQVPEVTVVPQIFEVAEVAEVPLCVGNSQKLGTPLKAMWCSHF